MPTVSANGVGATYLLRPRISQQLHLEAIGRGDQTKVRIAVSPAGLEIEARLGQPRPEPILKVTLLVLTALPRNLFASPGPLRTPHEHIEEGAAVFALIQVAHPQWLSTLSSLNFCRPEHRLMASKEQLQSICLHPVPLNQGACVGQRSQSSPAAANSILALKSAIIPRMCFSRCLSFGVCSMRSSWCERIAENSP